VFAPAHDVDGLATLMGGRDQLIAQLEIFFNSAETDLASIKDVVTKALERPYYWGGNEPDIHVPYMFAQAGRPDLTQKWARWAATNLYSDLPDGLPGNDDGGTMGAWYVFTAMGLYPLPGTDRFIVGAPLFPRLEVTVEGGTFTVLAPDASAERPYVQAVTLDGAPLATPELRQSDLHPGAVLQFEMGPAPSSWGR
jgi:putative alpha-1,2-mannosidase